MGQLHCNTSVLCGLDRYHRRESFLYRPMWLHVLRFWDPLPYYWSFTPCYTVSSRRLWEHLGIWAVGATSFDCNTSLVNLWAFLWYVPYLSTELYYLTSPTQHRRTRKEHTTWGGGVAVMEENSWEVQSAVKRWTSKNFVLDWQKSQRFERLGLELRVEKKGRDMHGARDWIHSVWNKGSCSLFCFAWRLWWFCKLMMLN